jgi:sporulation protein YlmC with PRC-barrel domain
MISVRRLFVASSALALSATLVGQANAQNTSSTLRNDRTVPNSQYTTANTDHLSTVTKANKASDLIGMDVRNSQNEKLGDIKDLAVDLHTGKIAYAVLSVGGFLGIGDKYVAVPPESFQVAPDGKSLILNADKARIQNAPGFAKNEWPDLNTPAWRTHSSYWLGDTALGGPAATSTGTGTHSAYNTSRDMMFHGKVTAVDTQDKTITVQGTDGTRTFKIGAWSSTTSTVAHNNEHLRLSDVRVGDPVVVSFHQDNGNFIADNLTRSDGSVTK